VTDHIDNIKPEKGLKRLLSPFSDWPVTYINNSIISVPLTAPTDRFVPTGYVHPCIDDDDDLRYYNSFTAKNIMGITLALRKVCDPVHLF
jgi:hypothetical protein